jgi:hypothetical protein
MRSTGHNNARKTEPAVSAPTGADFLFSAEFLSYALLEIKR